MRHPPQESVDGDQPARACNRSGVPSITRLGHPRSEAPRSRLTRCARRRLAHPNARLRPPTRPGGQDVVSSRVEGEHFTARGRARVAHVAVPASSAPVAAAESAPPRPDRGSAGGCTESTLTSRKLYPLPFEASEPGLARRDLYLEPNAPAAAIPPMQSLELALGVGEPIGDACSLPFQRSLLRGLKACAGVVALVEREWLGGRAHEGAGGSVRESDRVRLAEWACLARVRRARPGRGGFQCGRANRRRSPTRGARLGRGASTKARSTVAPWAAWPVSA